MGIAVRSAGVRAGLISEDPRTHVIARADGELISLCGAGTIMRWLSGDYQRGDALNCPRCEELATLGPSS